MNWRGVFREMFGSSSLKVTRVDGEIQADPATKWLRDILRLAHDRLPSTGYETIDSGNSSANSAPVDELLAQIEKLAGNSLETLGRKFAKAMVRVRPPREPRFG